VTLLITQRLDRAAPFEAPLAAAGFSVVGHPFIDVQPIPFKRPPAPQQPEQTWLLFTSRHGVTGFFHAMAPSVFQSWQPCPTAVIGETTAGALRAVGLTPNLVSPIAQAQHLVDTLLNASIPSQNPHIHTIIWPTGQLSEAPWEKDCQSHGIAVNRLQVYHTNLVSCVPPGLVQPYEAVAITSGSSAAGLAQSAIAQQPDFDKTPLISLGPRTSAAIETHLNRQPDAEAAAHSLVGLAEATLNVLMAD